MTVGGNRSRSSDSATNNSRVFGKMAYLSCCAFGPCIHNGCRRITRIYWREHSLLLHIYIDRHQPDSSLHCESSFFYYSMFFLLRLAEQDVGNKVWNRMKSLDKPIQNRYWLFFSSFGVWIRIHKRVLQRERKHPHNVLVFVCERSYEVSSAKNRWIVRVHAYISEILLKKIRTQLTQ